MSETRCSTRYLIFGASLRKDSLNDRLASLAASVVEAAGTSRSVLEVHMLYGIRADQLARLANEGYSCSSLVAYGEFWYPWYMRRLAERPANLVFALRQLLP